MRLTSDHAARARSSSHQPITNFSRIHGIVMVFFFMIPSIPAVLGNFLVPMMIGAKDLAFPRLNLLSWYIYIVGAIFTFTQFLPAASIPDGRSTLPTAARTRIHR